MELLDFSRFEDDSSKFTAKLGSKGGYVTFTNSSQKEFVLGLDSFLQCLRDIKKNLAAFKQSETYNEGIWRNLGGQYFTDKPANALITVQTKPMFTTLSKIIALANIPELDSIEAEKEINLAKHCLQNAIIKLEEVISEFTPKAERIEGPAQDEATDAVMQHEEFNVDNFIEACSNAGLIFPSKLHARLVASLTAKPFLLLTGLSGSGKTKIAQAFAKWICEDQNQYCLVAVGADWTNREPLLGYPNALEPGTYVKPDHGVLDLLMHANAHPSLPHFLILDEMNLSHVERYFADFLSVMESDEELNLHPEALSKNGVPGKLGLPKNLFIIGTVNIDETTYMFSPKVLDRANTIEFRVTVEDMEDFLSANKPINLNDLVGVGKEMAEDFVVLAGEERGTIEEENIVHDQLLAFFKELRITGSEFGYRTANEILILIYRLWQIDTQLTRDEKIDIAVIQKLLPKLHGSRNKLKKPLEALARLCIFPSDNYDIKYLTDPEWSQMPPKPKEGETVSEPKGPLKHIRYRLTLEKLGRMYRNLMENGYTSFAEA